MDHILRYLKEARLGAKVRQIKAAIVNMEGTQAVLEQQIATIDNFIGHQDFVGYEWQLNQEKREIDEEKVKVEQSIAVLRDQLEEAQTELDSN